MKCMCVCVRSRPAQTGLSAWKVCGATYKCETQINFIIWKAKQELWESV